MALRGLRASGVPCDTRASRSAESGPGMPGSAPRRQAHHARFSGPGPVLRQCHISGMVGGRHGRRGPAGRVERPRRPRRMRPSGHGEPRSRSLASTWIAPHAHAARAGKASSSSGQTVPPWASIIGTLSGAFGHLSWPLFASSARCGGPSRFSPTGPMGAFRRGRGPAWSAETIGLPCSLGPLESGSTRRGQPVKLAEVIGGDEEIRGGQLMLCRGPGPVLAGSPGRAACTRRAPGRALPQVSRSSTGERSPIGLILPS